MRVVSFSLTPDPTAGQTLHPAIQPIPGFRNQDRWLVQVIVKAPPDAIWVAFVVLTNIDTLRYPSNHPSPCVSRRLNTTIFLRNKMQPNRETICINPCLRI